MGDAATGLGVWGRPGASRALLAVCLALASACQPPDITGFSERPDAPTDDAPASDRDGMQETAGAPDTVSPGVAPDTPPAEVEADSEADADPADGEADADPADSDPGPTVVTVTLDPQGGQIAGEASLSRSVGGTYGPLPEVTRAGHAHLGWWTEPEQGGDAVDGETLVTQATDHTLFAAWAPVPAPRFVTLPPGSFQMGSPPDELGRESNETSHPVTLTRAFRLAVTEVTQAEWKTMSGGVNPSSDPDCGDTCPVDNLSWWSALGYANARSTEDGLAPCYALSGCSGAWQDGTLACPDNALDLTATTVLDCDGYRLPTEAEWEYAARAGTETATYAGDLSALEGCPTLSGAGAFPAGTPLADLAWYPCNSDERLHPVAEKAANLWGLHDMLGNVQEWTYDFRDTYNAQDTDPTGPATGRDGRVFRGGSALAEVWNQRAAARPSGQPNARSAALGLRLARTAPPCEPACRNGGYCTDVGTCSCPDSHEGPTCADPILVTVTFDAQGGTTPTPDTRDLLFSAPYGALPETSRQGYILDGWWTAPEASGEEATSGTRVTRREAHTLFAAWTANYYVLTFDSAGGSPCEPLEITFDAPYGPLCVPIREGHAFDGWVLGDDLTGFPITAESRVSTSADHTLRAVWRPNRYTVTFDSEGGSPCEPMTVTYGQPYGPLCAPTRTGYTFDGWWMGDDGLDALVIAESTVATLDSPTLHARWRANTYTVVYDSTEGTGCDNLSVTFGDVYGTLCAPLRPGFAFDGWSLAEDEHATPILDTTPVTTAGDHTLRAGWVMTAGVPALVDIEAGTFTMGSPPDEVGRSSDESQHTVTLTHAFHLGQTEVTQGQWKALSGGVNPSYFPACGDNCPVEQVSWWSALGYLNALSASQRLPACYAIPTVQHDGSPCTGRWEDGNLNCGAASPATNAANLHECTGFRLPTEAEWEYAARAGTATATYGGNLSATSGCVTLSGGNAPGGTPLSDLAWYDCNSARKTQIVGGKAPNAWGLLDMLGSVWEWTHDWYMVYSGPVTDPLGGSAGTYKIFRGGCWAYEVGYVRAADRAFNRPGLSASFIGFRVARTSVMTPTTRQVPPSTHPAD
jgi:uncharacterized repeat protein (TIGR02543 family)